MRKLDPQLEFIAEGGLTRSASPESADVFGRFGMESADATVSKTEVALLVQFEGEIEKLVKAGFAVRSVLGDIATGTIAIGKLDKLAKLDEVKLLEAARAMHPELDLALVESRANLVHAGPPGRRGAGVIVGVVDSGCDYSHPCFRNADGTSRILFIWDQGLVPGAGEANPTGFTYGVEYSNAQINAALATANPFAQVRHRDNDPNRHGTHVTGIAAGNGRAAGPTQPAGRFIGVAPEADIVIVANASNGAEGLGTSANTLDAVNYIFQRAQALSRACVVNMSLGDNLGPHDGTSLVERGLDNLLGGPGRAFVKSAGNAASGRIHAQGNVATGTTVDLRFNEPAGDTSPNQIDLWYEGADSFSVSVVDPAGNTAGPVAIGSAATINLPGGNSVRIDHRNNDPLNGDKRIFMTFQRGTAAQILPGNWTIRLGGTSSPSGGRFDAWIQRGTVVPTFLAPHESNARTISTPGSALEVITAANYITRGAGVGSLASSSSRGPTRDGRAAPTIAAPGSEILSALGHFAAGADPYHGLGGTSMAAPHIAGTIALMFQKNGTRTQEQIRACLQSTARSDASTGPVPNTAWGAGKLDANAAVNCVPGTGTLPSVPACPSVVTICASVAIRCPTRTIACRPSVVTICPTTAITCRPTVIPARCPTSPIACPPATVIPVRCPTHTILCRPSVVTICPTRLAGCNPSVTLGCQPSVLTLCPSQTATGCGIPSVAAGCLTVARCPSVIDGCPSAPGGCDPFTVVINPGGPVFDPGVFNPGGFNPGGFNPGPEAEGWYDWDESAYMGGEYGEAAGELPEAGFYEYDDGWFDE